LVFKRPRKKSEVRAEEEDFQCSEIKMLMTTSEILATGGAVLLSGAVGIVVSSQHPDRVWVNIQSAPQW
jgi:hypothetical protein